MIIRGEATFVLQEISTLASLEGLRIFPESEAICMENATAGNEASRSTEGALRISPASAGSKNATAGGAASRSTESALHAPQYFSAYLSAPGYAWPDRTDNKQAVACWSISVGGLPHLLPHFPSQLKLGKIRRAPIQNGSLANRLPSLS